MASSVEARGWIRASRKGRSWLQFSSCSTSTNLPNSSLQTLSLQCMLTTSPSLPLHAPHRKPKLWPKLLLTSWSSGASNVNSFLTEVRARRHVLHLQTGTGALTSASTTRWFVTSPTWSCWEWPWIKPWPLGNTWSGSPLAPARSTTSFVRSRTPAGDGESWIWERFINLMSSLSWTMLVLRGSHGWARPTSTHWKGRRIAALDSSLLRPYVPPSRR